MVVLVVVIDGGVVVVLGLELVVMAEVDRAPGRTS